MSDLPELFKNLNIQIPGPIEVSDTATLEEAKKADIEMFNVQLKILYALWAKVDTVSSALTMIDKTLAMIRERRKLLCLPYGSPENNGAKRTWDIIP